MGNLLVIDWDYFFRNPMESGDFSSENGEFWLYDWGHNESWAPGLQDYLWTNRAAGFIRHGLPLPECHVPDNFWDRFDIDPDAVCELSDSNMYSGVADNYEVFDHVYLFDAHHDLYTIETQEDLDEWVENSKISCEDWMFMHYLNGSKLHWRWPRWHKTGAKVRATVAKWVGLDARKDDMGKIDIKFDAVSICRSGSWVPPWCDEQFERFYMSCPVKERVQVDDCALKRDWDEAQAVEEAKQIEDMRARAVSLKE